MSEDTRTKLEVFRVNAQERRELTLLAKARRLTKSDLIRKLVREAVEKESAVR